jgi:hypothetical protein
VPCFFPRKILCRGRNHIFPGSKTVAPKRKEKGSGFGERASTRGLSEGAWRESTRGACDRQWESGTWRESTRGECELAGIAREREGSDALVAVAKNKRWPRRFWCCRSACCTSFFRLFHSPLIMPSFALCVARRSLRCHHLRALHARLVVSMLLVNVSSFLASFAAQWRPDSSSLSSLPSLWSG